MISFGWSDGRPRPSLWWCGTRSVQKLLRYASFNDSDSVPIFFSPAAFFSLYFFTHAAKLFPDDVSFPVNARTTTSEEAMRTFLAMPFGKFGSPPKYAESRADHGLENFRLSL